MKAPKVVVTLALVAVAATAPYASAEDGPDASSHHTTTPPTPAPWTVVASGLHNPRHLTFNDERLFVVEAGTGGSGPCLPDPEDPNAQVCFGTSGSLSQVRWGRVKRVVTGLPSTASPDGSRAVGASDVQFLWGDRFAMTIGLGADPAVRSSLPRTAVPMASVVTGSLRNRRWTPALRTLADLGAFEATANPDGGLPDSNPTGLALTPYGVVVTDSGANALVRASWWGDVSTVAVFGSPGTFPSPFPPPGTMVPAQSVPTSVVQGPDGAWYVSELTGFPFKVGASRIIRVDRWGNQQVWATGLTNVTDLAWSRGKLYAVQIADTGLLTPGMPSGSLVQVSRGAAPRTVVDNLPAPYSVAFQGSRAYLTTCAVCPADGAVVTARIR